MLYQVSGPRLRYAYDGVITTDSAWGRGKRVCGTEDGTASLDDLPSFPNHGTDGTGQHIIDKTKELLVSNWSGKAISEEIHPGKKGLSDKSASEILQLELFK